MPALLVDSDSLTCCSALRKLVGCLYPTLNLNKPLVFQLWIPLFSSSSPLPHPHSPCAHTRIMFTESQPRSLIWALEQFTQDLLVCSRKEVLY